MRLSQASEVTMRSGWLGVALLLLAGPPAGAQVKAPPFTFQVPAGWVNLSPGAPEENFRGLPPALLAQARKVHFMAMDMAGAHDGFAENVNANIVDCMGRFTPELMEKVAGMAPLEIQRLAPGSRVRIIEKGLVDLQGVKAGRMVFDCTLAGGPSMRQLQYHVPGGRRCAILTFSSTPGEFSRYLPVFEAAARAIGGVAEPPAQAGFLARIGKSALRGALIGGIAGGLAVLLVGLLRRKKRRSPPDEAG
jgi:hypothetical protein